MKFSSIKIVIKFDVVFRIFVFIYIKYFIRKHKKARWNETIISKKKKKGMKKEKKTKENRKHGR